MEATIIWGAQCKTFMYGKCQKITKMLSKSSKVLFVAKIFDEPPTHQLTFV